MHNFTAIDLVQTSLATLAFALFLLPPGYVVGMATDLFGMRRASGAEKLLFSVALSIAITPIVAVLLTRATSYTVTLALLLFLALLSLLILRKEIRSPAKILSGVRRSTWLALGMAVAWFLVVQLSLAGLQAGHRLYLSYLTFDHSLRVPMVAAVARWGVPPRNPFYGLGKPPVLRYYYYWYVVCALPVRFFGLSAKGCLDASVFWSGVGLASLIPLYLKHFCGEHSEIRGKSLMGIALLTVTGLDILPYLGQCYSYRTLLPDMEWWDTNQVTSWMGALLWVPHHVASLTACMAGLLVFTRIRQEAPLRRNTLLAVLAGAAFASSAGLSVYVVFPFALFAAAWTLRSLARKEFRKFFAYLATGTVCFLLSLPYLRDLLSKPVTSNIGPVLSTAPRTAGRFAFFSIREYVPALDALGRMGVHNPFLLDLSKLVVMPFVYELEFGFFGVVLFLCWRHDRKSAEPLSENRRMAWWILGICLLAMSFLKSATAGTNDLGWRGMLVAQFVLLVWAAPIAYDLFPRRNSLGQHLVRAKWLRSLLLATMAIGLIGTTVQLTVLRVYAPLAERGAFRRDENFLGDGNFGERTYWMRKGFERINQLTSPHETVQYNPVRHEVLIAHLYSARQAVVGDSFCGSAFGGNPAVCRQAFPYFTAVFNAPKWVRGADLNRFCNDYGVNVLVANDTDPVWKDPDSWVWQRPLLYANPSLRAVSCGNASSLPPHR